MFWFLLRYQVGMNPNLVGVVLVTMATNQGIHSGVYLRKRLELKEAWEAVGPGIQWNPQSTVGNSFTCLTALKQS